MSKNVNLILGMIEQCNEIIETHKAVDSNLPSPLQNKHLLWMCSQLNKNVETWPMSKIHRWLGFIQCAMMANKMIDLPDAKTMFDGVKDIFDNNSPSIITPMDEFDSLYIDIGGEG